MQTNAQTNLGDAHSEESSIDTFFAEKIILVTGATGFLGKAILEKLLRSCLRVATIFVLIRPKKNLSVEERLTKLLENSRRLFKYFTCGVIILEVSNTVIKTYDERSRLLPFSRLFSLFDRIRSEFPGALNKIFPVKGDLSMPEMGLQPEDKDMLIEKVNIVFHSAATVRFDEPLKNAVNLNVRGTDRMLDLCRRMTNLISIIHVSTAYSNADRREIEELIYTTGIKPEIVMDICENLDDETIGILEKKLITNHPNTYTLTKALAEQILLSKGAGLPIAIVRPSIICAAYREPFPGWVDNVQGITGIMMGTGIGIIRSIVCNANLIVDVIPVDFVVDTLICASWHNAMQHIDTIRIYNCTSSALHPITWSKFGHLTKKYVIESPSKYVMWYPGFTFRTNKFIHAIMVIMLHFLPAFIVDLVSRVRGYKPKMVRMAKRFKRSTKTGEFFAINEWKFSVDNMRELVESVKALGHCNDFNVDIRSLDWDTYLHQYVLGIRKYILKDDLDTLNNARRRLRRLNWVDKLTKLFGIFVLSVFVLRMILICWNAVISSRNYTKTFES
ncbi:putative fatty acyl-CoA reductase CG5065 isoform X2 [Formica exsecta]|uniref:putative fatty acyl-CoA reductase CG5065 isoform X2 n=1 Tax=Formica exsecta TaxID=72781 RepID=UPI0011441C72|nr:putative fatty acyl-CoA reductase CG5065 isoform X2 [Formica exsecta]